ncbi:MAG: hypothetical protein ACE5G2_10480 [Candidatus Krumholzibacteriia bacterium]
MTFRISFLLASLVILGVGTSFAQNQTDLQTIETIIDRPGQHAAVIGDSVRIRVFVKNLGPDPYDGTTKPGSGLYIAGGGAGATVDIDEPSKPGILAVPVFSITDSFAVNIAVDETVTLDFGIVGFVPGTVGLHSHTTTVTAGVGNIDADLSNNQITGTFPVGRPTEVPVVGWLGLAAIAAAAAGAAARGLRRRRQGGALEPDAPARGRRGHEKPS